MKTGIESSELAKIAGEVERASKYYYNTSQRRGIDNKTKEFLIKCCDPYVKGPDVLEFGYIDGLWTDMILKKGCRVDIVEGASSHIKHARRKYAGQERVKIHHELFQAFKPSKCYDTIVAGDMLRYIDKPVVFLKTLRSHLKSEGNLIVTIPNSRSLHKRIGTLMDLEPSPTSPNKRDLDVGNTRSYDRYELRSVLLAAGYKVKELRGCFLKPLSSAQMNKWDDKLLNSFFEIGKELEDYCWFLYAVCKR